MMKLIFKDVIQGDFYNESQSFSRLIFFHFISTQVSIYQIRLFGQRNDFKFCGPPICFFSIYVVNRSQLRILSNPIFFNVGAMP